MSNKNIEKEYYVKLTANEINKILDAITLGIETHTQKDAEIYNHIFTKLSLDMFEEKLLDTLLLNKIIKINEKRKNKMNINLDSYASQNLVEKIIRLHNESSKAYKVMLSTYYEHKDNLDYQIEMTQLATKLDLLEELIPELYLDEEV